VIDSQFYERTALSRNKVAMLRRHSYVLERAPRWRTPGTRSWREVAGVLRLH
jgi:hypothetical protein